MSTISEALLHLQNRNFQSARNYFQKAIEENGNLSQAHAGLANCLSFEGNFDAAKKEVELGLDINPLEPLCYLADGIINDKEGKLEEAETAFYKVLDIVKDGRDFVSGYAFSTVGIFFLAHNKIDNATKYLLMAKKIYGKQWVICRNLSLVYLRKGENIKAIKESFCSLALHPSKQGLELTVLNMFRAFPSIPLVFYAIALSIFLSAPKSTYGIVVFVMVILGVEALKLIVEKKKENIIISFLALLVGLLYYLVYVR